MAMKALRLSANPLLHLPATDLSTALIGCLSRHLVPSARHPYRLVRRETLLLVNSLDWAHLGHVEHRWVPT